MQKLNYPLLMVHGMGFHDNEQGTYWGRIPAMLQEMGCQIFYGYQDSNAPIEVNARCLAQRIEQILRQTGAEKLNVIAHSKGGLDMRYTISSLGMGDKIASLTTIASPHHGSKTMDKLMKFPDPLVRLVGVCADIWFRILGDKEPHSYDVFRSFTTEAAKKFNEENPDHPGVYYQSYAFVMKKGRSDKLMCFPHFVVGRIEGENDGLLTPDSVKWGAFRGIHYGAEGRGISHLDEVDLRRRPFAQEAGEGVADILDVYREIIDDLICRGF